ncbi:methyltransferase family protein [Paenarthrobacter sp. NPDC089714]|uniref:methyltransferase family protein n=1 Tax=Paenarthrobacter sp. NPDC089714 TaxID=3364377 RepID=UPI00381E6E48
MIIVRRAALVLKREAASVPLPPRQVVGLVLDVVLGRLYPTRVAPMRGMRRIAGVIVVAAGVGVTAWAVAERRRHTKGNFVLGRPEELVTSGPYAASRHPMYLGWWLIHAGVAIFRGSSWALATLPAGILVEHLGALWEEKVLLEEFGPTYAEYMQAVPRYVGNPVSRRMRVDEAR